MTEKSRYAVYWPTIQRRALRELERLAEVRQLLEAGVYSKEEAKERGL